MDLDTLAGRLRSARKTRNLSQAALAERAGVRQSTVGNIESGARDGANSLALLAHALAVRYFWLRDGNGDMDISQMAPDAQAIAEAFDALPTDTEAALARREWLYTSIIGTIANQAASASSAPALSPALPPNVARLLPSKTLP